MIVWVGDFRLDKVFTASFDYIVQKFFVANAKVYWIAHKTGN